MTPLEVARSEIDLRETAVLLLTAGGKNADILGAFHSAVRREPRRLVIVCATTGSKLAAAAAEHSTVEVCEFDPPPGRDGFLATNSLFASGLLLIRAYALASGVASQLPGDLQALAGPQFRKVDFSSLLSRETIVVLHPPSLKTVAVEIESKFTEAALGHVQIADYRQFAHGRHHWLAKRGDESAVLALSTVADDAITSRTLRLLPDSIPVVRLALPHAGPVSCLSGVAHAFELVRQAGKTREIDPGDPGVPTFGRRLYNLGVFPRMPPPHGIATPEVAIARKSRVPGAQSSASAWQDAYAGFLSRLSSARIRALVLDYDGTLCDEAKRFDPLPAPVGDELSRVLRAGIPVGIATGRGKSVRERLQEALPRNVWDRVLVGYYNGADIGLLSDDNRPDGTKMVSEPLRPVEDLLVRQSPFLGPCETELRPWQITLKPAESMALDRLWQCMQGFVAHLTGVEVLRSGHSIDILAPGVSKLAVVRRLTEMAGCSTEEVLCVGDQGCWPGNDHKLLGTSLSLSSNVTSADPDRCWNIAPAGVRESQATLGYLSLLKKSRGGLRFDLPTAARNSS
ncbi:MAG: sucrose-6-phosphate hydrolase [Planctomycetes bacterium]|nr:sucrose-6-phosphate hydrolase [Planctomycetota bacterium]